jgi:hypothetical protein
MQNFLSLPCRTIPSSGNPAAASMMKSRRFAKTETAKLHLHRRGSRLQVYPISGTWTTKPYRRPYQPIPTKRSRLRGRFARLVTKKHPVLPLQNIKPPENARRPESRRRPRSPTRIRQSPWLSPLRRPPEFPASDRGSATRVRSKT